MKKIPLLTIAFFLICIFLLYPYLFRKLLYLGKSETIDPKIIPGKFITIDRSGRKVNAHL